jgi:predicted GNAT family acetyltransferase
MADEFDLSTASPVAAAPQPTGDFDLTSAAPVKEDKQTAGGAAQAAGTGVNKALLSDLPGLPADTWRSIVNLGRAVVGYAKSQANGKWINSDGTPATPQDIQDAQAAAARGVAPKKPPPTFVPAPVDEKYEIPTDNPTGGSADIEHRINAFMGDSRTFTPVENTPLNRGLHTGAESATQGLAFGAGGTARQVAGSVAGNLAYTGAAEKTQDLGYGPGASTAIAVGASLLGGRLVGGAAPHPTPVEGPKPNVSAPEPAFTPDSLRARADALDAADKARAEGKTPSTAAPAAETPPPAPKPAPAAPKAVTPPNKITPETPIDERGPVTMLSAERGEHTPEANAARTDELEGKLKATGLPYAKTRGMYTDQVTGNAAGEDSFTVTTPNESARQTVRKLADQYDQQAVLHVDENGARLHNQDGTTIPLGAHLQEATADEAKAAGNWTEHNGKYYIVGGEAPAENGIKATPNEAGGQTYTHPAGGTLETAVRPNGVQSTSIEVPESARGKGVASDLVEHAIKDAHAQGLDFHSDSQLSPEAMQMWNRLQNERGVEAHANAYGIDEDTNGRAVYKSENGQPIFTVPAPKAGVVAKGTTTPTGPAFEKPSLTQKAVEFKTPEREGTLTEPRSPEEQAAARATLSKVAGLKEVRKSAITGDYRETGTDFQTSKLKDTPHGDRLAAVIQNEQAALRDHAQMLVDHSGGVDGTDAIDRENSGRILATPVENYERHLDAGRRALYAVATDQAKGQPFALDEAGSFLSKNKAAFLGTPEGKQLLEGLNARAEELGVKHGRNDTFNPATVEQAEQLRQYANENWTPKTAKIIAQFKDAIDRDVTKQAGTDLFEQARAAQAHKSKILDEPEGIQMLRGADDRLGINREVDYRDIPAKLAALPPQQLGHVIDTYARMAKINPEFAEQATAAVNEIRGHYANQVRAIGKGKDTPGGAWNAAGVNKYLRANLANMQQVFSPAELAEYKTLNDAGNLLRMDRSYPGAAAQAHGYATNTTLALAEHGATGVGAVLGHIPGMVLGYGAGKALSKADSALLKRAVEHRIENLTKPSEETPPTGGGGGKAPLGQTGAGSSERGGPKASPEQMMKFRHFSRDANLTELDPNKQGTGAAATLAERNRSTKVAALYPYQLNPGQPESMVTAGAPHQYIAEVPRSKMYDAVNDPDNLRGNKSFDAYERAIKAKGYSGYYVNNPDNPTLHGQARMFTKTPVTPAVTSSGRPLGWMMKSQRGSVGTVPPAPTPIDAIRQHLTGEEGRQAARKDMAQRVVDAFDSLPHTHELAAAALAGQAKRGWYRQSAEALTNVFGADAPRFTALLAAMSPQVSVQTNLHNAIHTFVNWDNAGRPTDPAAIKKIMGASVQGDKGEASVLPAWVNNSIKALTHPNPETVPMLSGPKVDSFTQNLRDNVNAVTLDAWMASFAKLDASKLGGSANQSGPGKSATYLAYSAKVRQAAAQLTQMTGERWTPAEVQETVWSWAKTAYEHAEEYGPLATIPELVHEKRITDDLIRSTPDFATLLGGHAETLAGSRFSAGAERLRAAQGERPAPRAASEAATAAAETLKPHLTRAAERLEALRQERNTAEPIK